MPSLSNKVGIQITSDYDNKGIDQAERSVSGLGGKLQAIGGIGQTAFMALGTATLAAGAAIGGVAFKAINAFKEMEQSEIAFTTLLKDRGKALEAIANIQKDAIKTPFDPAQLIKANQLLISAGVSAADARKDIMALGNAVAATGGGADELSRLAVNLQQIKAVGKASALDIKQFAFAGIPIYKLLEQKVGDVKKVMGKNTEEYQKANEAVSKLNPRLEIAKKKLEEMTSSGKASESAMMRQRLAVQELEAKVGGASGTMNKLAGAVLSVKAESGELEVTYKDLVGALQAAADKGGMFEGALENQSRSIQGSWSNLQEVFQSTLVAIGRSLSETTNLGQNIARLSEYLAANQAVIVGFVTGIINWVGQGVTSFMGWVNSVRDGTSNISVYLAEMRQFWEQTMMPILQILGEFASYLWDQWGPVVKSALELVLPTLGVLWNTFAGIMTLIRELLTAFRLAWETNFLGIRTITQFVVDKVVGQFKSMIDVVKGALNFIIRAYNTIADFVPGIMKMAEFGDVKMEAAISGQNPYSAQSTAALNVGAINIYDSADYQSMLRDMSYVVNTR